MGGQSQAQGQNMTSISFDSEIADIQPQLQNYDNQLSTTMKQIGVAPNNIVSKSLLMALSAGSGDMEGNIGSLVSMFNADSSPDLHQALVSGNSKEFFDLYLQGLMSQGVDQAQATQHLLKVDKLRDKIQKAYN
jgi:hypothetical protein